MWRASPRWVLILLVAVLCVVPSLASASGVQIDAPPRWERDQVEASANQRATAWAEQAGMELATILANPSVDDFVETIAVLTSNDPLPARFLEDEAFALAELERAVGPMIVGEPELAEMRPTPDGVTRFAHAVWRHDVDLHASLFPTEDGRTLVLMAARSNEAIIYDDIFATALSTVRGAVEPRDPYDVASVKKTIWIGAFVLGVAAYLFAFLVLADRAGDHAGAGRRAAGIMLIAAVVGTIAIYLGLADVDASIVAAGATRSGLAGLCLVAGLLAGALAFIVGGFADRGDEQKVGAAPTEVPLAVRLAQAEAERAAATEAERDAAGPPPPPST